MPRDPLDASQAALVDQADFTVRQLRGTAAAAPWLATLDAPMPGLADDLAALAVRARALLGTTSGQRVIATTPYLDAAGTLAAVKVWAAETRDLLRLGNADAESRRLAGQVRASLVADLRWVNGTIVMLERTLPLLRRSAKGLGFDAVACADRMEPALSALRGFRDERADKSASSVDSTRGLAGTIAELRRALRRIRALWKLALSRSEGAFPALDLSIGASDVANRKARPRKASAASAPSIDAAA